LKILIHDYSGHPFQVQLSRALAARGHEILHIYCASFQSPKGNLTRQPDDPDTFQIRSVALAKPFLKDTFLRRRNQEVAIGRLVAEEVACFRPEIVVSSNAPLDCQRAILAETHRQGAKFVFWLQDIYSEAICRILSKKMPGIGGLVGRYYQSLEYGMLKKSDHIISIAQDFVPILIEHLVAPENITVIENWAPLNEIAPVERDNEWVRQHMSYPGLRVVYSGTLGYKHNPQLLVDIAKVCDGHVYVFSEGRAADELKASAREQSVDNLHVLGWVPFEALPSILSGADAFIAIIEKDAGIFSVPSKVLTYLCIGRPIIGFIPEGNLARTIILRENAGIVGDPDEFGELAPQIAGLFSSKAKRTILGRGGRNYAKRAFNITSIADRFERILGGL